MPKNTLCIPIVGLDSAEIANQDLLSDLIVEQFIQICCRNKKSDSDGGCVVCCW